MSVATVLRKSWTRQSGRGRGLRVVFAHSLKDCGVQTRFCSRPSAHRRHAGRRENKRRLLADAWQAFEDFQRRVAQRDFVRHAVLGALGWQGPKPPGKVDFGPSHSADLVSPGAGQDQHFDDRPEWIADTVRSAPDQRQLVISSKLCRASFLSPAWQRRRKDFGQRSLATAPMRTACARQQAHDWPRSARRGRR